MCEHSVHYVCGMLEHTVDGYVSDDASTVVLHFRELALG